MEVKRLAEGGETWDKTGRLTAGEIKYHVIFAPSKDAALQAVFDAAPRTFVCSVGSGGSCGLAFRGVRFDGYVGEHDIEVTALYEKEEYDDTTPTMSWDCSGGTKHVTHAIRQKEVWPTSGGYTSGGFIGWNNKYGDECQIAGVDIPAPNHKKTYTKVIPISFLVGSSGAQYENDVGSLVGKVNDSDFMNWPRGSVMFEGASYSTPLRRKTKVVVTYNFRIQPAEANVVLSSDQNITVSAEGFEYIDTRHKTVADPSTNKPKLQIEKVTVNQVTHYGDFSKLKLNDDLAAAEDN